jgi:molybdopterin-guanine dinucleotide biosynthesis protein A
LSRPRLQSVSGVVLAGGKGSRLGGVNKALLEVGGQTNIDRVLAVLGALCDELVLVANDKALVGQPQVRLVMDAEPHAGVLPALAQGLGTASGQLAIVVACDMPFLSSGLLAEQLKRAASQDVVMPVVGGRPEPMHAVYRPQTCLTAVRNSLAAGERRMISFLDRLRVSWMEEDELRVLDPELLSFFNTNTREDLERARILAGDLTGR